MFKFELSNEYETIDDVRDSLIDILFENDEFEPTDEENWGRPYYLSFKGSVYEFSFKDSGKSDEPQNGNYPELAYLKEVK